MTNPILPEPPPPMQIPAPPDLHPECPEHGALTRVAVIEYTRPGGKAGLHLRAACPDCGLWVRIHGRSPWFVPRAAAGLHRRTEGAA